MNQKDKERKERVAHIINIPDEYSLVVDDQEGVDDRIIYYGGSIKRIRRERYKLH